MSDINPYCYHFQGLNMSCDMDGLWYSSPHIEGNINPMFYSECIEHKPNRATLYVIPQMKEHISLRDNK